jgi:hypothetical protein
LTKATNTNVSPRTEYRVAQVKRKATTKLQSRLLLGLPTAVERKRARHCRLMVTTAPYAILCTRTPAKYVLSLKRATAGRSGAQLELNCMARE